MNTIVEDHNSPKSKQENLNKHNSHMDRFYNIVVLLAQLGTVHNKAINYCIVNY